MKTQDEIIKKLSEVNKRYSKEPDNPLVYSYKDALEWVLDLN